MATGGWGSGYTSNPFAQQAAAAAAEQAAERVTANARQGNAFGAWGGGAGAAPPAPAAAPVASAPPGPFAAPARGNGDIAAREADLQRREAELLRREAALAAAGANTAYKNWPPCCPFLYHDIREQVPAWNRSMVRFCYLVELVTVAAFFYNAIIIVATLFANTGPGLQWFFLSLLALVMGVPLSWWLFYKGGVFRAAQTDGATYAYIRAFLLIMLHMAWCVWMILAIPGLGAFSAGVFPMLKLFQQGDTKGIAFGVMYIINVCLWGIAAAGCFLALGLAVAAYRRGAGPRAAYEQRQGGVQMMGVA